MKSLPNLRIGCVRYLNARPLIESYDGPVTFAHPSELADQLNAGELDVALVPAYEALRHPECVAVDGVAIASRGTVWSVILAYKGALEEIRRLALDPASRTSAHLCKVFFAEWGKHIPEYASAPDAARLLIGDQAIAFRESPGYHILDFGEEWLRRTGLPFVFAVWLIRPEVKNAPEVADVFREIARRGRSKIRERHTGFALQYLTEYIRFDVGAEEKCGLERFRELLCKHGYLPPGGSSLRFV